ncbi:TRAP transporter small permease [Billgrantia aerodenitrificans]|uniref:TRAP transporter small permease protein n=1 Tax=Billgrantia aerodenitrificans TaxID=2733483 RepID=A0ABS9AR06_9GAMM|nr:TRAP transporter small permease [Halomonas aerodenitrificans]MCE8024123.1 TRAP transporter small permease [Halomonas aerodenitrificans]
MLPLLTKAHDATSELGLHAGLLALALIALLTFVGTMSRYFLGAPIGWIPDWSNYLLAGSVFVTAPAVTRRGLHVSMDILPSLLPSPTLRKALTALAAALTCTILAVMSWLLLRSLVDAWGSGTTTAAAYPIPRWWLLAVILYGFASSGLHVLRAGFAALFVNPAVYASGPTEGA